MSDTDDIERYLATHVTVQAVAESLRPVYEIAREVKRGFIEEAGFSEGEADRLAGEYMSATVIPLVVEAWRSVQKPEPEGPDFVVEVCVHCGSQVWPDSDGDYFCNGGCDRYLSTADSRRTISVPRPTAEA